MREDVCGEPAGTQGIGKNPNEINDNMPHARAKAAPRESVGYKASAPRYRPHPERRGSEGGAVIVAALATVAALIVWGLWHLAAMFAVTNEARIITYDPGGSVQARIWQVEAGPPAVIVGTCASACVMHLARGCVAPGAVLIFHGPHGPDGRPLPPAEAERWSRVIARHLPPALAAWYMAEGRFSEWQMTGAEAIRLGARPC